MKITQIHLVAVPTPTSDPNHPTVREKKPSKATVILLDGRQVRIWATGIEKIPKYHKSYPYRYIQLSDLV